MDTMVLNAGRLTKECVIVQMVVTAFVEKVCRHPLFVVKKIRPLLVPIIEVNNNEVAAASILAAIKSAAHTGNYKWHVPFTKALFQKDVSDNLGVRLTHRGVDKGALRRISNSQRCV